MGGSRDAPAGLLGCIFFAIFTNAVTALRKERRARQAGPSG
jgi:hypothetical protein